MKSDEPALNPKFPNVTVSKINNPISWKLLPGSTGKCKDFRVSNMHLFGYRRRVVLQDGETLGTLLILSLSSRSRTRSPRLGRNHKPTRRPLGRYPTSALAFPRDSRTTRRKRRQHLPSENAYVYSNFLKTFGYILANLFSAVSKPTFASK